MDNESVRTTNAKLSPDMTRRTLAFEMSNQMQERAARGCLTFQGLAFDGIFASLTFMRIDKRKDILKSHRTALGVARYGLPARRPTFIAQMSELVRINPYV